MAEAKPIHTLNARGNVMLEVTRGYLKLSDHASRSGADRKGNLATRFFVGAPTSKAGTARSRYLSDPLGKAI